jgi:hypothetical protein
MQQNRKKHASTACSLLTLTNGLDYSVHSPHVDCARLELERAARRSSQRRPGGTGASGGALPGDGGSLLPQLVPRDALALGHDLGPGRRLGRGRHRLGRGLGLGRRLGLLGLLGPAVRGVKAPRA